MEEGWEFDAESECDEETLGEPSQGDDDFDLADYAPVPLPLAPAGPQPEPAAAPDASSSHLFVFANNKAGMSENKADIAKVRLLHVRCMLLCYMTLLHMRSAEKSNHL